MSETFSDWQCEALPYSSTRVKHTQAEYARIKILRVHALGNIMGDASLVDASFQRPPSPFAQVSLTHHSCSSSTSGFQPTRHSSPTLLHPSPKAKLQTKIPPPSESSTFLHNDEAYLHYHPLRSPGDSHGLAHSETTQHVPSRRQE